VARLRSIRPDVLHIHRALPRFGKWTIAAARAAAVPLIVTTDHDLPAGTEMARGWGDRLADRLLGAVIVASEYNRRAQVAQLGRPERLVHRIYCGIDLARFPLRDGPGMAAARAALGLPADALVIGSVARLVETKRIADLLAAAARLAAGPYPQLHVLIAGEGPLRPQLEAQAAALGLAAVRFLGYHPDSAEAMRAMDVFVLPSSWEGFGLVAAEAMATGAPVVATQAGGLAEVVADGAGLLVPVGDLDALTAAIARCLGDPGLRQELSAIGRRRVEEHFSAEAMARGVTDIYGRLLGRRAER
jgi:glycosyltransferase involved in cell wall biosynthesis